MERKFKVFNIKWEVIDDVDEKVEYPSTTMEVTISEDDVDDFNDDEEVEFFISDYISDETSFLHEGFEYEEIL